MARPEPLRGWEPGWCGGFITTYACLLGGTEVEKQRALRTLDFAYPQLGTPSGYFCQFMRGNWQQGDGAMFDTPHARTWLLTRTNADALYYSIRQFHLLRREGIAVKAEWTRPAQALADAFVRTFNTYGQPGQFVDLNSGDITVGGSSAAALAPAGLALAAVYFDRPDYLATALAMGGYFRDNFTRRGLSTGGPFDALQCPDSESCYALLESYVALYEASGDRQWLDLARNQAAQLATWIMSYDFVFPPQSLFNRLDIRTNGSVFANVQNKHSAPALCTHSGMALLKLHRHTGDARYIDLLHDIAHGLTQYVSRPDRPIADQSIGWVNERVNTSDWLEGVGEIFHGQTWAAISILLSAAELPGLYVQPDTGFMRVFDHVEAEIRTCDARHIQLRLTNPTAYPARLRVLCETSAAARQALDPLAMRTWPHIDLAAGETREVDLPT